MASAAFSAASTSTAGCTSRGLLRLKPGVRAGEETESFFHGVDWSETKAYALGLAGIYINLRGREGQGIVPAEEADRLKADIAAAPGARWRIRGRGPPRSGV